LARKIAERCSLKGGGNERTAQLGGADMDDIDSYRNEIGRLLTNE
jgi:alanyl-tRNA synthetase